MRQMSADGAADLRRRAAPSARTRHGGEAIDAAKELRLRAMSEEHFVTAALLEFTCLWIVREFGVAENLHPRIVRMPRQS